MRLDDCFKKRLLRTDKPDILKSKKALEMANLKIERAGELTESGFYEESIVSSYTGMFHSARALLFKDGITERSHACVIAYLSKEYGKTLGRIALAGLILTGWKDMNRSMVWKHLEWTNMNQKMP